METTTAKVVGPRDGKAGFLGSIGVRFMIDGEEAGGGFSLVEHPMSARALAAPLHRHTREDEYSYVLEGRVGALLGDEVLVAGPGDLIFKPRNQWHTFWNAGDAPARILEIISPAGFERFFAERRPRRRHPGRAADPGRALRPLRARDGPRERPGARRALRPAVPGRADLGGGGSAPKRVRGVEPPSVAWKAIALPLSYTRRTAVRLAPRRADPDGARAYFRRARPSSWRRLIRVMFARSAPVPSTPGTSMMTGSP